MLKIAGTVPKSASEIAGNLPIWPVRGLRAGQSRPKWPQNCRKWHFSGVTGGGSNRPVGVIGRCFKVIRGGVSPLGRSKRPTGFPNRPPTRPKLGLSELRPGPESAKIVKLCPKRRDTCRELHAGIAVLSSQQRDRGPPRPLKILRQSGTGVLLVRVEREASTLLSSGVACVPVRTTTTTPTVSFAAKL